MALGLDLGECVNVKRRILPTFKTTNLNRIKRFLDPKSGFLVDHRISCEPNLNVKVPNTSQDLRTDTLHFPQTMKWSTTVITYVCILEKLDFSFLVIKPQFEV